MSLAVRDYRTSQLIVDYITELFIPFDTCSLCEAGIIRTNMRSVLEFIQEVIKRKAIFEYDICKIKIGSNYYVIRVVIINSHFNESSLLYIFPILTLIYLS